MTKRNRLVKHYQFLMVVFLIFSGCAESGKSDAYGQFEATETTISSKMPGELIAFSVSEGEQLKAGSRVGVVDTSMLVLKRKELLSQKRATQSKIATINAEIAVQKAQLKTARENLRRIRAMLKDSAATAQQLDDAQGKVNTILRQIGVLETQKKSVRSEIHTIETRIRQNRQQINDSRIVNPVGGTVLVTYAEPNEYVGPGQALYKIANLDTLELRVYVSGAQLPSIRLGQQVQVVADKNAEENQFFPGRISWIASEAEFTPKMIQTKEERVTQVYAVKVKVPNEKGMLKIGMPGEINF